MPRVERALLPAAFDLAFEFDLRTLNGLSFRPEPERQRRRSGEPALSEAEGNLLCCHTTPSILELDEESIFPSRALFTFL